MVNIQSPTAEIRRGKKRKKKKEEETGWKYIWSALLHRATINDMRHYAMKRHIICESSMPCTLSPLPTITDCLNFTLYCADTVDIMLTYCFQGAPAKAPVPTFLNNYSKYVLRYFVLCLLCGIWSECLIAETASWVVAGQCASPLPIVRSRNSRKSFPRFEQIVRDSRPAGLNYNASSIYR